MGRDQGPRAVTVPTVAAGAQELVIGSPCRMLGWSLADAGAGIAADTATASFAAAASGTATLPAGASISGFDVTTGTVASPNTTTITVTGAAGGTLTFLWLGAVASSQIPPYSFRFPQPIPPAAPGGQIAVTFTGTANTPAGDIAAYGQAFQTAAQLLDSAQILGTSTPVSGASDTQWLADCGIYVSTGITLKCVSGSVTGCVYIVDGIEPYSDDY